MRFGIDIPPFDELADPRRLVELAQAAEASGWDGVFLWDHLQGEAGWDVAIGDVWVSLAAIAAATERIRLGPMVLALSRRRPWLVARESVTLDRLSNGRLILGAGMGFPPEGEFARFGEDPSLHARAVRLDEGLAIIEQAWGGRPFRFDGEAYRLGEVTFQPTPVQRPRIPVWVAANWPVTSGLARAARWDGIAPLRTDERGMPVQLTAAELRSLMAEISARRSRTGRDGAAADASAPDALPYDLVTFGETGADPAADTTLLRDLEAGGATWWCERINGWRGTTAELLERVRQGPPRT